MVHVIGSIVDLFQEVFQLLNENALLEPLQTTNNKFLNNVKKVNILAVFIITFLYLGHKTQMFC